MSAARRARLAEGCAVLGVAVDDAMLDALLAYLGLLERWNAAYNLTSVRDPDEMVAKHLLDSLAILRHLPRGSLIDVGTGAGLPGIPVAIVQPDRQVALLDSNGKKTRFCTQVVLELGLANVTVVQARAEQHRPEVPHAAVASRAFAELADFLRVTDQLGGPDARWLAMKGAYPHAELAALPGGFTVRAVHPLAVPGLAAERHLVEIVRA